MPRVSVIIPVYNVAPYLSRCLDSVVGQTLRDVEIICIDDCSTDGSAAILAEYAAHDSRIKVVPFEQNRGVSAARNAGLDVATGEWIGFVDSDDKIDLDFYEKLYVQASATDADIIKGRVQNICCNGRIMVWSDNEIIRKRKTRFAFVFGLWSAIYRKTVIKNNGIRFLEGCIHSEDVLFLNEFILRSRGLTLVEDVSYYYCRRENSANSFILSPEKICSAIEAHRKIIDNALSFKDAVGDEGIKHICLWCLQDFITLLCRSRGEVLLHRCVEEVFAMYEKVALLMSETASMVWPVILQCLKAKDKDGLYEFIVRNNTPQKMMFANLRYLQEQRKCQSQKGE